MNLDMWLLISYLVVINIITLVLYIKEVKLPAHKVLPSVLLIVLPIIGGSVGAILANNIVNTEHRELRSSLNRILGYLPPIMFIAQSILVVLLYGPSDFLNLIWNGLYAQSGIVGQFLLVLNAIAFVLVIIRKSAYYIAPAGNYLIPDIILTPILLLGGATGGSIAKMLFNFREDWSCRASKQLQNFIYNWGMLIAAVIQIGLYIYFFIAR